MSFQYRSLMSGRSVRRRVHACWDARQMAALAPHLRPGNRLDPCLMEQASRKGTLLQGATETLIKGLEVRLPLGHSYSDADGVVRQRSRVRWWDRQATTYRNAVVGSPLPGNELPDAPIPAGLIVPYDNAKPLFFGHYWLSGAPALLTENIACVDFSAGNGGDLMAYRWTGEQVLTPTAFFSSAMEVAQDPRAFRKACR